MSSDLLEPLPSSLERRRLRKDRRRSIFSIIFVEKVWSFSLLLCIVWYTVLHCIQYCIVYKIVLYCIQYCFVYSIVLYTVLFCIHYFIVYSIGLYCIQYCILLYTVLYCIVYSIVLYRIFRYNKFHIISIWWII